LKEQFNVYANPDKETKKAYPYFVDVQSNLVEELNSRVVIPLVQAKLVDEYPKHLCPIVDFQDREYALLTHQMASVSTTILKEPAGSLLEKRDTIIGAIDFLITGI
jgi:toxin CcdB